MNETKECCRCYRKCDKYYQLNGNLYECFDEISCKLLVNSKKFKEDGFQKLAEELYQYYKSNRYNKIKKPLGKVAKVILTMFCIPCIIIDSRTTSRRSHSNSSYIYLYLYN